jgi:hypothetical protein
MLFDTRVGQSEVSLYRAHMGAVLALSMFCNCIVTISEDRSLVMWDRRAKRVLKFVELYGNRVRVCYSLDVISLHISMRLTFGVTGFVDSFHYLLSQTKHISELDVFF